VGNGSIGSPADRSTMRSDREETLEAEIARLDGLGLQELRQLWRQRLGPPPQHISTELTGDGLPMNCRSRSTVASNRKPGVDCGSTTRLSRPIPTIRHRPTSVSSRVSCSLENGTAPNTVSRFGRRASSIATSNSGRCRRWLAELPAAAGRGRRSLASSADADPPMRRLYPQIFGGGAGTVVQFPTRPEGGV
jgi:hypothetical protein